MLERMIYTLREVCFSYGRSDRAVDGVSFEARPGEIMGLVGPNGSGKSTLIKLLAGLLQPSGGTVLFDGSPLAGYESRDLARRVAWMPQESFILYPFSVRELVLLGRTPYSRGFGFETEEDRAVTDHILETTGLTGIADRSVETLSGGQKQRVILASRLAQRPEVLLLDEPLAHLDIAVQIRIMCLLRDLVREEGLTVLMACHDLNLAAQYCDRILVLDQGKTARIGSPWEVLTEETIKDVYHCQVLVDAHPTTGNPRITIEPGYKHE